MYKSIDFADVETEDYNNARIYMRQIIQVMRKKQSKLRAELNRFEQIWSSGSLHNHLSDSEFPKYFPFFSTLTLASVMLRAADLPVNKETMMEIATTLRTSPRCDPSCPDMLFSKHQCQVEVEGMKKHKLSDTLTVYDLLRTNRIGCFSQRFHLYDGYPTYLNFINRKIWIGEMRFGARGLFEKTYLPLELIDMIISQLSVDALQNVRFALEKVGSKQEKIYRQFLARLHL